MDWNKVNTLTAAPNRFDSRDPTQTGGGFGLLPWYLRAAAAPQATSAPAGAQTAAG